MDAGHGDYPISVTFDETETMNQLWGIPILGVAIRAILVIPQWIVIWVLGVLVSLSILVTWIWILTSGRLPGWAVTLYEGASRMTVQVTAYVFLLTATYPPFWITGNHPVKVEFARDQPIANPWGIPVLGLVLRYVFLIPHYFVLVFVAIVMYVVVLLAWIPVLLGGRMAGWGYTVIGGYLRWTTRLLAYLLFVTDRYPPFRLRD